MCETCSIISHVFRSYEHDASHVSRAGSIDTRSYLNFQEHGRSGRFVEVKDTAARIFGRQQWTRLPEEVAWDIVPNDPQAGRLEPESPETHSLVQESLDAPEYAPFHLALDSGAADHVVNSTETPGYPIVERRQQGRCVFCDCQWRKDTQPGPSGAQTQSREDSH